MNKKALIISPYFSPSNAADMQRVRMSLSYYKDFGWNVEVVTVHPQYSDMLKDALLLQSIPHDIKIHHVKALKKTWTSKLGFGNIALRSIWFYKQKVNTLLKKNHFDLIYFSTTQFPVCILGSYWKKRFKVPYVIDMQDPWHSDYYQDKPKDQRPLKYWLSHPFNKYLESIAINNVDGLISVSEDYITDLKNKHPAIKNIPSTIIPFGSFEPDLQIAAADKFDSLLDPNFTNIVYIGRGGNDMHKALCILFEVVKNEPHLFHNIRLYFIGTSYAPKGRGKLTILPLAKQFGINNMVVEVTDRISYYHTLATLQKADALFIPGSDDPQYSASKIYPYLLTKKPLLAIFNSKSPVLKILKEYDANYAYSYDDTNKIDILVSTFLKEVLNDNIKTQTYNPSAIKKYSAENLTKQQCLLFDKVINENNE